MKSKLLALALGTAVSFSAFATPAISLPGGPIYFKFNGDEQVGKPTFDPITGALTGAATTWGSNESLGVSIADQAADAAGNASHRNEINWGVFIMSNMDFGKVNNPNKQIGDTNTQFFINGIHAQITGMFYGVQAGTFPSSSPFPATGGAMDLYWRDLDVLATSVKADNTVSTPGVRTAFDQATGYTQGTLLAHLTFASGIDLVNMLNFISGSVIPNPDGPDALDGIANSFANVDPTAGLWGASLNTDYFHPSLTSPTRDLRFKNSYQPLLPWDSAATFGYTLDDPGQAVVLPEPGMLSLMGLALVGMGAIRRRKQK